MADSATATSAAPAAKTPAATSGQGQRQGSGSADNNPQTQQSQPQSQQSQQPQSNNPNSASTPTVTNNENAPPERANPDQPANRGLPYYEKLRRELRDTLQKKRLMDKSMAQLEDQIYRFEQSYLEETTAGNIIKGFDNYIKGSSTGSSVGAGGIISVGGGGGGTSSRRKAAVTDGDRVFSRSSASFMRDSPAPSSAQTTPSHAPTPTSTYNGSGGNKANGTSGDTSSAAGSVKGGSSKNNKKKAASANRGDDDDDEKPPGKRLKISYGGRE
ncbi:histone acetyltransferase subunit NuA4-domain-containing protein [Aspergillus venezuelensis]